MWFFNSLTVPLSLRCQIPSACHDPPSVGHPGYACMISIFSSTFSWFTLSPNVLVFVKSFDSYQRTLIDTQASYGHLVPLSITDRPWNHTGVDFIVKLPLSSGFDSIFFIVDHFPKGPHFISCNKSMDAPAPATLFVSHFVCHDGFPDKIVFNQAPTFVLCSGLQYNQLLLQHITLKPIVRRSIKIRCCRHSCVIFVLIYRMINGGTLS